jgi:hypothetical protein
MAKKTASRGRAKTAKKATSKRKQARLVAKSGKRAKPKARKSRRAKAAKPAAPAVTARTQAQVKNDMREQYVIEQGNATFEDYFSSGSEHFGL